MADTLTVTRVINRDGDQWGRAWAKTWLVQGSTSYPTGGFTLAPQRFGLKTIRAVILGGCSAATVWEPRLVPGSTPKLMYVNTTTGADASGNVSAPVYTLTFVGD